MYKSCYIILQAILKPDAKVILGCYPQHSFKPMELDSNSCQAKFFLSGRSVDCNGTKHLLESTGLDHTIVVGNPFFLVVHNPSTESTSVRFLIHGWTVDDSINPSTCLNDINNPVIADIRPRGLDQPVNPVYTLEEAKRLVGCL